MKVYARGRVFILCPSPVDYDFKKKLRCIRYSRKDKAWYVEQTLASMIDLLRGFPTCFDHDDKETHAIVSKLKTLAVRLIELQNGLKDGSRDVKLPDLVDYVWEPYQHQKEAIAFALNLNKCALWLDMGLGKTYTSITVAKLRNKINDIKNVLVVAPKSLLYQWEQEVRSLVPNVHVCKLVGTLSQKEKEVETSLASKSEMVFYLVTYESVGTLEDLYDLPQLDMFILDESTKVKNPDAKRTTDTYEICKDIPYGIELTGMAYVNSPLDLYSQLSILDPTVYGENKWAFANRYIAYRRLGQARVVDHFYNMDELKKRAYLLAFSRTKASCLGLPEKSYQVRKLPILESQFAWYDNLVGQLTSELSEGSELAHRGMSEGDIPPPEVTIENTVSMLEKLQQVTSGFIKADNGEYVWLGSPKYDELVDILQSSKDSFIIWARHTYTINKIVDVLHRKGIHAEVLSRGTKDNVRQYYKEQFKSGKLKVLVLQIQSECRGNDFTCRVSPVTAVFFENTASIEERYQAEDRQHRIGMTGTALYIDLVCEDTYDEGILKLLQDKKTITEYIREQKLTMLLGKGGSVTKAKTRNTKKKPKRPEDIQYDQANNADPLEQYVNMGPVDGIEL